jgi:hypothetical protein
VILAPAAPFTLRKKFYNPDLKGLNDFLTKRFNEQVSRNQERFPEDFLFQLTRTEFENWKSQLATSNREKTGL